MQAQSSEAEATKRKCKQLEAQLRAARSAITDLLLDKCVSEKREREERVKRESVEIGCIGAQRIGHVVQEVWEQGTVVRDHAARVERTAEQRREAEKAKRSAIQHRKKAGAAARATGVTSPPTKAGSMAPPSPVLLGEHAVQDFTEEEDICALRVTELKEMEKRLAVSHSSCPRKIHRSVPDSTCYPSPGGR